jgi:serine/threonine-protein kinase
VDGTPQYLAPETALGRPTDGRVDIYALGVMAFEMVTGQLPFEAGSVVAMLQAHVRQPPPDIKALRPDLPEPLVEFIRGALVKKPEERLTDFKRILALLDLGGRAPELWTDTEEEVVRLRYRPAARPRVEDAVQALLSRVAGDPDIEVAQGRLAPPSRK